MSRYPVSTPAVSRQPGRRQSEPPAKRSASAYEHRFAARRWRLLELEPLEPRLPLAGFLVAQSGWVDPPGNGDVRVNNGGMASYHASSVVVSRYFAEYSASAFGFADPPPPTVTSRSTAVADAPAASNPETDYFLAISGPGTVVVSGHSASSGVNHGIAGTFLGQSLSRVVAQAGGRATIGTGSTNLATLGHWTSSVDLPAGAEAMDEQEFESGPVVVPDTAQAVDRWLRLRDVTKALVQITENTSSGSREGSGSADGGWSVTFIPDGVPDIAVLSVESVDAAGLVTFTYAIRDVDVVANFSFGFYASADGQLDAEDVLLDTTTVLGLGTANPTIDRDAAAATSVGTHTISYELAAEFPSGQPFLIVVADIEAVIAESDETNNAAAYRLAAPDIAFTSAHLVDDSTIEYSYAITGAVPSFLVGLYASPTPDFDPLTSIVVDVDGDGLGNAGDLTVVRPEAATGTEAVALARSLRFDAEFPYILAVADPGDLIIEEFEDNNVQSVELGYPPEHVTYELLAREYAYTNHSVGEEGPALGYTVERVFTTPNGLYAIGLTSADAEPLLVFRGTTVTDYHDLFADTDPRGVGFHQFRSAWPSVSDWLTELGTPVTLIGHSLGGALAQWFAAKSTSAGPAVGSVITFNSPGISRHYAEKFAPGRAGSVTHYVISGDLVSLAGESFLAGEYVLASFRDLSPVNKHQRPVLVSSAAGFTRAHDTGLDRFSSIEWLNSPFFTYADLDFLVTLAAAEAVVVGVPALRPFAAVPPRLAFRSTAEALRVSFGAEFRAIADHISEFLDAGRVQASLPAGVELSFYGLIAARISDMSLVLEDGSFRIHGKAVVPQLFGATADFSGSNYIEVTPAGIEVRGVVFVEHVPLVPNAWELKRVAVSFDTRTHAVDATAVMAIPMGIDVGARLGFVDGEFTSAELFLDDLNRPIVPPWPIFVQGLGGGVSHFAPSDSLPLEFFGRISLSGGPRLPEFALPAWAGGGTIGGVALAELGLEGHVDRRHLGAGGRLELAGGLGSIELNLPGTGPDRHDEEGLQLNWAEGFLEANGQLEFLEGVIQGAGRLRADSHLNFLLAGSAGVSLPSLSGVFPGLRFDLPQGRRLADGSYVLSFSNDQAAIDGQGQAVNDFSNDFLAFWTEVPLPDTLGGPLLFGYRIGLDGSIKPLAWEDLPEILALGNGEGETFLPTARYQVGEGVTRILLSALWSPASPETRIVLRSPDGTTLTEADIALRPDISIVEDFSDPSGRVVAINSPASGVWSVSVAGADQLDQVELGGLGALIAPSVAVAARGGLWGSAVDIQFQAHDSDSDATVQLYYDDDDGGADGFLIAGGLRESDGSDRYQWDPVDVAPGEYFVYAMIEDGTNPPDIVYAEHSITVSSPAITVTGPTSGVPGEPLKFDFGVDVAMPLVFEVDWTGDAQSDERQLTANGLVTLEHAFDRPGSQDVIVTVTEPASGASASLRFAVRISVFELRDQNVVVGGDQDDNRIVISLSNGGGIRIRLDETWLGPFDVVGSVIAYGHLGNDVISVAGNISLSVRFHGGPGDDYLAGGGGNDAIFGDAGDDRLLGGNGHNFLSGGDGNDRLSGRDGDDTLLGGPGRDQLYGGAGRNLLDGGEGDDVLAGGLADDVLIGQEGNDILSGNFGNDILVGGPGNDQLLGNHGNDVLFGGQGSDWLLGHEGSDLLISDLTRFDQPPVTDAATAAAIGQVLRDLLGEWQAGRFDVASLIGEDKENDDLLGGIGADMFVAEELDRIRDFQPNDRRL